MAEQGVLVLGPSSRFLEYIGQVLPVLGETAVVAATCDTLLPGIGVGRAESRTLAEIKGRALWQPALENYVASLLPRARDLKLRWEGEFYVIPAATVAQALAAVRGRPYHRARTAFAGQLHHILAEAVIEQREALLNEMEEGFEDILARVDRSMDYDPGAATGRTVGRSMPGCREAVKVSGVETRNVARIEVSVIRPRLRAPIAASDPHTFLEDPMPAERPARRRRVTLRIAGTTAVVLAVPLVVLAVSAWPSEAASAPAAGGVYTLASGASGKCVDVTGASTGNSALLIQLACNSSATDQQFAVVTQGSAFNLVNANSGKCVDVPNFSTSSGTQLWQYTCGTSTNQQWTFTASSAAPGKYLVRSVLSGLCVSDKDGSMAGTNPIVQESCSDVARMQWSFNSVSGATATPTSGGRAWSNVADGFAGTDGGTTGGAGGAAVTVTTYADLLKYATSSSPYVIRISGTITVPDYGYEIPVKSDKTLIGVGTTGVIKNGGIFLAAGVRNVIIRNLTIGYTAMASDDPDDKEFDYDGIQMDTADHVWIDHNTFVQTNDGMIDSRKDTSHLTVSWNILSNHNKTFGIGWTPNVTARVTIHHNWIHDTTQRNPSVDNVAYAHLYNNYLQNVSSYGNYSRGATKMVLENSYFDHVNNPYYYQADTGAQLKQSGSILVSCTGSHTTNGSAFNPSSFYSYTLDAAADVPSIVKRYSGPQSNISM